MPAVVESDPRRCSGASLELEALAAALGRFRFRFACEADLQGGIEAALRASGIEAQREVPATGGRLDFLARGRIAIEVKTGGSLAQLTRQVHRYLQGPALDGLLVVTTRPGHRDLPSEISGKPVRVLWVRAA